MKNLEEIIGVKKRQLEAQTERTKNLYYAAASSESAELRIGQIYESLRWDDRRTLRVERVLKTKVCGAEFDHNRQPTGANCEINDRAYLSSGVGSGRSVRGQT